MGAVNLPDVRIEKRILWWQQFRTGKGDASSGAGLCFVDAAEECVITPVDEDNVPAS